MEELFEPLKGYVYIYKKIHLTVYARKHCEIPTPRVNVLCNCKHSARLRPARGFYGRNCLRGTCLNLSNNDYKIYFQ